MNAEKPEPDCGRFKVSDLKPTGKVIILKDNERVIDKWSLRLLYACVFFTLLSSVLRFIGWIL